MVVAVNKLIRPGLSFMEASRFLDGRGPFQGTPVPVGLAVAGEFGSTELATCELMGIEPATIAHLAVAKSNGLLPEGPVSEAVPIKTVHQCVLRRTLVDWLALGAFHSKSISWFLYDSPAASPLHRVYYALTGGRTYVPDWSSRERERLPLLEQRPNAVEENNACEVEEQKGRSER